MSVATKNGNGVSKANMGKSQTEIDERKRKQLIGAGIFSTYVGLFAAAMVVSFMDLVPEFEFERTTFEWMYDRIDLLGETMHVPLILSFVYLVFIFSTQSYMKDKKPFDLRMPLALWSFSLAAFSILGSLRTIPAAVKLLYAKGWDHLVCGDTRYEWAIGHAAGFWTYLFILSKVPELIDTVFIVLRKKKLITLHWYHHVTVLCYCWHAYATVCATGIIFSSMNLTVHAIMYFFYGLTALGYRPTKYAQYITILQLAQMVVGTAVTVYANYHLWVLVPFPANELWSLSTILPSVPGAVSKVEKCTVNPTNALAGAVMYASYFGFFAYFFYEAYLKPKASKKKVN